MRRATTRASTGGRGAAGGAEDDEGSGSRRAYGAGGRRAIPHPPPVSQFVQALCTRARVEMPHKKGTGERTLPEVHFDFCFMGMRQRGRTAPKAEETMLVLMVREVKSKMTLSTGAFEVHGDLCCEAGGGILARDRLLAVRRRGQERPGAGDHLDRVGGRADPCGERRRHIVESSPVGSSGSNGVVERAIRSVEQQVRVMKDALEHRSGMQLTPRHPLVTWTTEYAGHFLRPRRQDGVREVQEEAGEDAWHRVRGGDLVEAEGRGRSSCEDDVLVGRWRLLGSEGGFRRQERRVEEAVEPARGCGGGQARQTTTPTWTGRSWWLKILGGRCWSRRLRRRKRPCVCATSHHD